MADRSLYVWVAVVTLLYVGYSLWVVWDQKRNPGKYVEPPPPPPKTHRELAEEHLAAAARSYTKKMRDYHTRAAQAHAQLAGGDQ